MPYGRRHLADTLTAEQQDALAAADWDGTYWVVPSTNFEVLRSLASAELIDERRGRWVLTLKGHRHRRATTRPADVRQSSGKPSDQTADSWPAEHKQRGLEV